MIDKITKWCIDNRLSSPTIISGEDNTIVEVDNVGKFLLLSPTEDSVIDEDFAFIVNDTEYDILDDKRCDFILFEFGGNFYYSKINKDKNRYNEVIFIPEFSDFKYLNCTSEDHIMDFVHLGIHSEYELLNGSGSFNLWVKKAKFLGLQSVAICDKNTLAGALSFQTVCESQNIKSIIGETITVAVNYDPQKDIQETFELKLYVLNYTGWKNLLLINKAINVTHNSFIPDTELYDLGEGLCCVIPKESEFNYYKDDRKRCVLHLVTLKKSFDYVYYQIDTLEYASKTLFKGHLSNLDNYLCNYADKVQPILINDSYYLDKEEYIIKGTLNKIAGKAIPEGKDQYFKSVGDTFASYDEWLDEVDPLFQAIVTGIQNTTELSDKVNFRIETGERRLPHFEDKDTEGLFFEMLDKGFKERLGHLPQKEQNEYLDQLQIECDLIVPNGLCDYFMILWDVMNWCRDKDILTGTGRGSVCGSLIAYLLYITDVDPLKYGLLFSRFLNAARTTPPELYAIEFENGDKINVPVEIKEIPLVGGGSVKSDKLESGNWDIDVKRLKQML